jgi:hypothetical protein
MSDNNTGNLFPPTFRHQPQFDPLFCILLYLPLRSLDHLSEMVNHLFRFHSQSHPFLFYTLFHGYLQFEVALFPHIPRPKTEMRPSLVRRVNEAIGYTQRFSMLLEALWSLFSGFWY